MNKPFIEIDAEHFSLKAFDIKPIAGYDEPINKETGEHFPYCCLYHKHILEEADNWFEKFPDCCEDHKKMAKLWWFQKSKYNGVSKKIVTQISYTEHHICEQIEKSDWYKDITDYIEYNIFSFGQPAIGLHIYLNYLKHYIESHKVEFPKEKRLRLIEYINGYYRTIEAPKTDLNILYATYQEWLKEFPFGLNSYFGNLKQHFENQLPILNGKPEINIYSGLAKVKMHTKSSLFEALINLTDSLLTQINGARLYEEGLIIDANQVQVDLLLQERKFEIIRGYTNSSPDEDHRYRKMLKAWLNEEQIFWKKLTPYIDMSHPLQQASLIDPLWFINEAKQDFYYQLTSNKFSTLQADEMFLFIINIINQLKEIRKVESQTRDTLSKSFEQLLGNNPFDNRGTYIEHWLIKALENNDTYVHAYHYLIQCSNSRSGKGLYLLKTISRIELFKLLEKENEELNADKKPTSPTVPADIKTFASSPSSLPALEKVFFVHYQCDRFEEGNRITSLCVYDNIDIKIYVGDEAKAIEDYCNKVEELNKRGLIPVHWCQNSPYFGIDHIKERYKILTGSDLSLEYPGSLNLADYLKYKYGENYVPHRRLDNLARINCFSGIYETDSSKKTFPRDRILLLSKIYFNELKGTLKLYVDQNIESSVDILSPLTTENTIIDKSKLIFKAPGKRKLNPHTRSAINHKLEINIEDFFKNIKDCSITKIETYNIIEKLTNNFEVLRLKILLNDFEFYFSEEKEERHSQCTKEEIIKAVDDLRDKGMPIPYHRETELIKDVNGKPKIIDKGESKILNLEKLLYPFDFFCCYEFVAMLNELIQKHEIKVQDTLPDLNFNSNSLDPLSSKPRLDLNEYKSKLDFTLGYYVHFFALIDAIESHRVEMLMDSINYIKLNEFKVILNEHFLTEQAIFDLDFREYNLFYNYGFTKIENIINTFNIMSKSLVKCFSDVALNKYIHDLWPKHSENMHVLFVDSSSPTGFIKLLHERLESNLLRFKLSFTKLYSLSTQINVSPNNQSPKRIKVNKKSFPEYFQHSKPILLADAIKTAFAKDTIMTLTILIHTLRHEYGNNPWLIIGSGELKDFHVAMKEYFNGKKIGERTNYKNDINYYRNGYKKDIDGCKARINTILQSIDK
ncbi:MAG: hypothetical protein WCM93_01475 [Bacteroidota bacterium]